MVRWWEELKTTTQHVLIRARRDKAHSQAWTGAHWPPSAGWSERRKWDSSQIVDAPPIQAWFRPTWEYVKWNLDKPWKYQVKPRRAPTWLLWLTWTRCCARRCTRSRGQGAPAWISPEIRKHLTLSALSVKSFNLNQSSIQKMQCVGSHLSIFMFCTCYNLRWNLSKCDTLHIEWVVWQWKTLYNITPLKILFLFTWYTHHNVIACAPEGLWTLRQRTANRWCLLGSRAAIFQNELEIDFNKR